jgi:hypothetical protein
MKNILLSMTLLMSSFVLISKSYSQTKAQKKLFKRSIGQTEYLSFFEGFLGDAIGGFGEEQEQEEAEDGGGVDIEQTDLYKISKSGRYLFYVNNYRGLQIVDLKGKGKVIAETGLIKRVPIEMFLDEVKKQVIIYEQNEEDLSSIAIYDYSNIKKPVLTDYYETKSGIARLIKVGSMIYSLERVHVSEFKSDLYLNAYKISNQKVSKLHSSLIKEDVYWEEDFFVLSGSVDKFLFINFSKDSKKYLKTFQLSQNSHQPKELGDIELKHGRIQHIKQLKVYNDQLILVTEKNIRKDDGNVFQLAIQSLDLIDLSVNDEIFISKKEIRSQVRDVKLNDDTLYVFWVPTTKVDPLEKIGLLNNGKKLVHDAHLEFEGFVERSFPLNVNGKEYILGVGEKGDFPYLTLFEVKNNNLVEIIETLELNMFGSEMELNQSDEDREIEFIQVDSGKYKILLGGNSVDWDNASSFLQEIDLDFNLDKKLNLGQFSTSDKTYLIRSFYAKKNKNLNYISPEALNIQLRNKSNSSKKLVYLNKIRLVKDFIDVKKVKNNWLHIVQGMDYVSLELFHKKFKNSLDRGKLSELLIKGRFIQAQEISKTKHLVLTYEYNIDEDKEEIALTLKLNLVEIRNKKIRMLNYKKLNYKIDSTIAPFVIDNLDDYFDETFLSAYGVLPELKKVGRNVFLQNINKLIKVSTRDNRVSLTKSGCDALNNFNNVQMLNKGGDDFLFAKKYYSNMKEDAYEESSAWTKNFTSVLKFKNGDIDCDKLNLVNIPGVPRFVSKDKVVSYGIMDGLTYEEDDFKLAFFTTNIDASKAVMKDVMLVNFENGKSVYSIEDTIKDLGSDLIFTGYNENDQIIVKTYSVNQTNGSVSENKVAIDDEEEKLDELIVLKTFNYKKSKIYLCFSYSGLGFFNEKFEEIEFEFISQNKREVSVKVGAVDIESFLYEGHVGSEELYMKVMFGGDSLNMSIDQNGIVSLPLSVLGNLELKLDL